MSTGTAKNHLKVENFSSEVAYHSPDSMTILIDKILENGGTACLTDKTIAYTRAKYQIRRAAWWGQE